MLEPRAEISERFRRTHPNFKLPHYQFFSVQPLRSLCLYGSLALGLTTETENAAVAQSRK